MNKYNQIDKNSKQKNKNLCFNRKILRSKAYKSLQKQLIDPLEISQYIYNKKNRGKGTAFKVLDFILYMSFKGKMSYPSTEYLAHRIGVHCKTISRVTTELQDIGLIKKHRRGFNTSLLYQLTNLFNNEVILYTLHSLFPFLKGLAFSFLITNGYGIEGNISAFRSLLPADVTLEELCYYNILIYKEKRLLYIPKTEQIHINLTSDAPPNYDNTKNTGTIAKNLLISLAQRTGRTI
jgi:hypothetical protein